MQSLSEQSFLCSKHMDFYLPWWLLMPPCLSIISSHLATAKVEFLYSCHLVLFSCDHNQEGAERFFSRSCSRRECCCLFSTAASLRSTLQFAATWSLLKHAPFLPPPSRSSCFVSRNSTTPFTRNALPDRCTSPLQHPQGLSPPRCPEVVARMSDFLPGLYRFFLVDHPWVALNPATQIHLFSPRNFYFMASIDNKTHHAIHITLFGALHLQEFSVSLWVVFFDLLICWPKAAFRFQIFLLYTLVHVALKPWIQGGTIWPSALLDEELAFWPSQSSLWFLKSVLFSLISHQPYTQVQHLTGCMFSLLYAETRTYLPYVPCQISEFNPELTKT